MRQWGRRRLYALTAAAMIAAGGAAVAASSVKTVTLDVDGVKRVVRTVRSQTVSELLRREGIAFSPDDVVKPGLDVRVDHSMEILVIRGKKVRVRDGGGEEREVTTHAQTVGEVLKELGLTLNEDDAVNPPVSTAVFPGQGIEIIRRSKQVVVAEQDIPFQTERQSTDQLFEGEEKVLSPGVKGLQRVTTTIFYENGKEVDRKEERTVLNPPVNRVVAVGTKPRRDLLASRGGGGSFATQRALTMVATAYTGGGMTATGHAPVRGTVAVDPSVIPLGTQLYIPGYGSAVADDVGGAIRGNRVDLYFPTEAEARAFGRRTVTVYIVR